MILCGWCSRWTADRERCASCGHADPARPWVQRGMPVPEGHVAEPGRPTLDPNDVGRRLSDARHALGPNATVERIAEYLDVSPRTVRRWTKVAS